MLTIPKKATELESLTVRDLRKIALELQISGRSKMKKAELVRAILTSNVDKESAVELLSRSGTRSDSATIQNSIDAPETLDLFESFERNPSRRAGGAGRADREFRFQRRRARDAGKLQFTTARAL